jgi:hypothetical protein
VTDCRANPLVEIATAIAKVITPSFIASPFADSSHSGRAPPVRYFSRSALFSPKPARHARRGPNVSRDIPALS